MLKLINEEHIFNEQMLENVEMIPYENNLEETKYVERKTFQYFEMLQEHLRIEKIEIDIKEAYKSLEYQENEFIKYMQKVGIEEAKKVSAMPGYSDFHTGQAIEIMIKKDSRWLCKEDAYNEEKIIKKIHNILPLFGFIVRYPKGKENITNHTYNPLHIRFIGKQNAHEIKNLSLEEYVALK